MVKKVFLNIDDPNFSDIKLSKSSFIQISFYEQIGEFNISTEEDFKKINSFNNSAFKEFYKFLLMLLCLFITLICCFEYDYLSILISEFSYDKLTFEKYEIIIASNFYLPYSIVTLICSSLMMIFGVNIKNKIILITIKIIDVTNCEFSDFAKLYSLTAKFTISENIHGM